MTSPVSKNNSDSLRKTPARAIARAKARPLALEARLMFDGAAVATAVDAVKHAPAALEFLRTDTSASIPEAARATDTAPETIHAQRQEVVFVDTSVVNWQTLVAGVRSGIEVVLLDPARDAFAQMAERLEQRAGLHAIHLISHGSVGSLTIGGQSYQEADLAGHQSELATIGRALAENGDLLLYGCDVGQGSSGAALVDALARATGADVAASTDTTGSARNFGGNWTLERSTGNIDSALFAPLATLAAFDGKLATINLSGNGGWTAIMYGNGKDPDGDSQAGAADTDIVGDASHGSLYAAYDDNGTVSTADDTLVYRLRIDNPTSSTYFGGVAIVGMDANLDGRADLFMAVDGRNNGQAVKLYDPGTEANISPNTTTTGPLPSGWLANGGVYAFSARNYAVTAVSAASDPHFGASSLDPVNGSATDLAGDGKTDVFVSWRVPLADVAAVLAKASPVDRNGIYGPRGASGIAGFTKDTVVQYISFTQTQTGPINGDLNGVGASYDKNATFAQLGAFTAPMSASNPVSAGPGLAIVEPISGGHLNDAEDNNLILTGTSVSIADGTKVTVTVSDGTNSATFVDAATVNANAWSTSGLDLSAFNNGTLTFTATASTATDRASVVHDKTAPLVTIAQLASAVTGRPTLSGTSDLTDGALLTVTVDPDNVPATANLVYQMMVTGGAWSLNTAAIAPVSGSMPAAGLTSIARISVTATDVAGNSSTALALNRPTVTALSTNNTTPVVSGTWTNIPGDTLSITVNGVSYTPVINGNSWSVTVSTPLAAGTAYEVVATAQRAGTPSVSDTSTLEASITSSPIVAIDITGDSAGDPTHNGTANGSATLPVISGTSSNAGGFVIVRLDPNNDGNLSDAVTYSVTPNGAGAWTLNTASATSIAGTRPSGGFVGALGILASDSAGAVTDSQVLTITTPMVAIGGISSTATASALAAINNGGAGANFLNRVEDDAVVFSGTASGGTSVNLTITDASGNFLTINNVAVSGGNWSSAPTDLSALDNGILTVRAALNGTSAVASNSAVTHDKAPPLIFNTTASEIKKAAPVISGSSELFNTVLTVSFTPAGGTLQTVDVTTDGTGRWSTGALLSSPSGNPTSAAVNVAPKVAATAVDSAGNIAQSLSWTQTISANASTKTITVGSFNAGTDIVNSEVASGVIISGTTTMTTSPTVSIRVTDINGAFVDLSTTASAGGAWSATLSNAAIKTLANGPLTVKASAVESGSLVIYDIAVPATLSLASPTVSVTDDVPGTASSAMLFTFTFNESVSGFDISDIDVTNGNKGTFTTVNASTYTLSVTPTSNSAGTLLVSVAGAKAVSTNTGRGNVAGSDSQPFETTGAATAPTVSIATTALASSSTPVLTGTSSLAAGSPVVIAIDNDNDGNTDLSYSATVQSDHNWTLNVATATPASGTLPGGGLNSYARITATATNGYGNSSVAVGLNLPGVITQSTSDNTPTISGSWTQIGGDTIAVVVNGVTYSVANGNLVASATGWSITTGILSDATYSVTATTTRLTGGSATDLTTGELIVDTTAGADITTHGGGATGLTNDATPVIAGIVTGIPDGTTLTLSMDTDNNGSYELSYTTVVAGGTWSVDTGTAAPSGGSFPAAGLNGPTPIRISATDPAGNTAVDMQTLTVDVSAPLIALTTNSKTADTTPLITGTSDLPVGATITIDVDPDNDGNWSNAQTYTTTVDANGRWSVQTGAQTTGTTVGLRASGSDLAGNSAGALKPLEIVANAPAIAITSPIASVGVDGVADAAEDDSIVLVGTSSNLASGSRVTVTITDGSITITDTATVQAGGGWALSALNLSGLANGNISVTALATDSSGDTYADSTTFVHNKAAVVAIDSISLDTGLLADFVTADNTVSISGSATPNGAVQVLVKDNGGATVATFNTVASAAGAWTTATTSALASGVYAIEATVAGVTFAKSMTIVDAIAPTLVASTPADDATGVAGNANLTLTFSKNVQAGAGFAGLYRADGLLIESFNVATGLGDAGGTIVFNGGTGVTLNPFADLATGTTYYIKIASSAVIDSAGNAYAGISNSTALNFTVNGADVTAPVITGPSGGAGATASTKTVNENSAPVAMLAADEVVTWSVSGGADSARFAINAATGALNFITAPDFESPTDNGADNVYVVQVRAVDGSGNASTQTISVTVADLDEVAPAITGPSGGAGAATAATTINENGTAVTLLAANETASWSINGGVDAAKFLIDASTGALSFLNAPDFESPTDAGTDNTYVVQVCATDPSGNASTQIITVTVADVDEVPPAITGPSGGAGAVSSAVTINENTTGVTTVAANEAVTWSVAGGADAAKFAIDAATGALSFIQAPDFENPADANSDNAYVVQVRATDANGNASTQTIIVSIADVDEVAPSITGPSGGAGAVSSALTINENSTGVTTVVANEAVTWSVAGGADAAKFAINAATGALSFLQAPDFESPADANGDNAYVVQVRATDMNGNTSMQTITVAIADVDEVAPAITGPSGGAGAAASTVAINENSTAITTVTADEAATWALSAGADAARFSIDAATGALRFVTAPDFESPTDADADNIYIVQVQAQDGRGNTSVQTITVTVLNLGEGNPTITGPSGHPGDLTSTRTIDENSAAVTTFSADVGVTWAIGPGADAAKFSIDATTGALRFVGAPDFEQPTDLGNDNDYVVQVLATDVHGHVASQTVTVTVADVDEVAPLITGPGGVAGAATTANTINENSAAVTTFSASEAVSWSLVGGADAAHFTIDTSTGALSFISAPDFESPTDSDADNIYVAVVRALDGSGNASSQTITVTVADVDEVAPAIIGPGGNAGATHSSVTTSENSTAVTTVAANEAVTWSVAGGADVAKFAINAATGELSFIQAPDFEMPTDADADNAYIVQVRATDTSGNASTQTITVTVADVDEVAPAITGPGGGAGAVSSAITMNENSSSVTTVVANEVVTWSVTGGADVARFAINAATGALSFIQAPDFESPADANADNAYIVEVRATDANGNASIQTVTVTIADIDEVAPVITGPSGGSGAVTSAIAIDENSTAVSAFGASEAVTWSIGGADAAKFTIDAGTGELRFISAPDFETPTDNDADNVYVIQVQALDSGGNASTQTVAVTVLNLGEGNPTIIGPNANPGALHSAITVDENNSAVATFSADVDVAWSIGGGADASMFAIDAVTGALRFIGAPDFEQPGDSGADNGYMVQVRATDGNGHASMQTVTVTVGDLDEVAPQIVGPGALPGSSNASTTINEGTRDVTTLSANEAVTWSIAGGADAGHFGIDAVSGVLRFTQAPDFDQPSDADGDNTYRVDVRAIDANGNASIQSVAVRVVDLDDVAPAAPTLDLLPGSDSGISSADKVTNVTTPLIRVTLGGSGKSAALAGDKIALLSEVGAIGSTLLSAQDIANGYADMRTTALPDGVAYLRATVSDGAGNVSPASAPLILTVDTTAPAAPTVTQVSVRTGTPVISGTAAVQPGERLSVVVNTISYVEGDGQLVRNGAAWSLTIPERDALAPGTHSVTAILTDAAGNARSDATTDEVLVGAVLPTVPTRQPAGPEPVTTPAPAVDAQAPAPASAPEPAATPEVAPPVARTTNDEISKPLTTVPAPVLGFSAGARLDRGADVVGILTVRGDDAFQVVVVPASEPALLLYRGVRDQQVDLRKGSTVDFRIPADAFMHTDVNATVKLVATLSSGEALPSWLRFDATTGRFEGTIPENASGELIISIKALDSDGRHAETIFRIKLVGNKIAGRQGLGEQLRLASKRPAGLIPIPRKAA